MNTVGTHPLVVRTWPYNGSQPGIPQAGRRGAHCTPIPQSPHSEGQEEGQGPRQSGLRLPELPSVSSKRKQYVKTPRWRQAKIRTNKNSRRLLSTLQDHLI